MRDDDKSKIERLMFYKEDIELIEKIMGIFLVKSQAKCTFLIDKEGHLIVIHGEIPWTKESIESTCALIAGTFAATQKLVSILEEENSTILFHQGKQENIQVMMVGDRALLVVIFNEKILGLVNLMRHEVSKRLEKIFEDALCKSTSKDTPLKPMGFTDPRGDDYGDYGTMPAIK